MSAGGALALQLCAKAVERPVDCGAILVALAASLIIIVNAVFLQSGSRAAPYLLNPKPQAAVYTPKPAEPAAVPLPAASTTGTTIAARPVAAPQPAAVRHNDPIADLIGPSPRIAAVQRALSDYGYGQIKPSGILDDATSDAIEKFERAHRLPVTRGVSERLVTELGTLVGHPIE